MSINKGILVFCEFSGDSLTSLTLELIGAGSRLAKSLDEELSAVLIGDNAGRYAQEAISSGVSKVYVIEDPLFKESLCEPYLIALNKVIHQISPSIILLGQTTLGRDLAPCLAFHLNTVATMDCVGLELDPSSRRLLMTRPVYGGNAEVIQICETDPQIVTVRAKSFDPAIQDGSRQGEIIRIPAEIDPQQLRTKMISVHTESQAGVKLEEARVVVAGGRGIGSADGFKQLGELAGILNGAVGATRPPCDKKWIADSQQIGLTGKIVSPDLYFAVGLSGASQHLSGCYTSRIIVAINKDPEANIFKAAHYGIVDDWKTIVPVLISRLKEVAVQKK